MKEQPGGGISSPKISTPTHDLQMVRDLGTNR